MAGDNTRCRCPGPCATGICFALVALLPLCAGCGKGKQDLPIGDDSVSVPYQEFEKATLYSYEGTHRKWRLQSLYMRKPLTDTGLILAVPVVLHLYDTTGGSRTKILADSGTTTAEMESFEIWGDVYVKTRDDLVIRSERLELDYETRQWHSDTFVEIRSPKGDVMRGKGFDAREDFSHSSFRSNVTGRFPEFRERFGEDELF